LKHLRRKTLLADLLKAKDQQIILPTPDQRDELGGARGWKLVIDVVRRETYPDLSPISSVRTHLTLFRVDQLSCLANKRFRKNAVLEKPGAKGFEYSSSFSIVSVLVDPRVRAVNGVSRFGTFVPAQSA
jgi:hypothetical protein